MTRSIAQVLEEARARLKRVGPQEAYELVKHEGAVLVDTRPQWQRDRFGQLPGALIVERNHLEWRFDPQSDSRLPIAGSYDLPIIVVCQEGYSSSLAAASLQDLGLHRATDLIGGFAAWKEAGLESVA